MQAIEVMSGGVEVMDSRVVRVRQGVVRFRLSLAIRRGNKSSWGPF